MSHDENVILKWRLEMDRFGMYVYKNGSFSIKMDELGGQGWENAEKKTGL